MGNALFPALPGLSITVDKSPEFITKVQKSVNGRELRASFTASPIWTVTLSYEFLRSGQAFGELQSLQGFFLARRGSWDSFLFLDPNDNIANGELFGIGDGVTHAFTLKRSISGAADAVANVKDIYQGAVMWDADLSLPMWDADSSLPMWDLCIFRTSDYTISNGLVTFTVAPPPGSILRWVGSYYYRCRFKQDSQQYEQFLFNLWTAKKVEFLANLGTKL